MSKKTKSVLFAAALAAITPIASATPILMFDLRFDAPDGKGPLPIGAGSTVSVNLYAVITGDNTDHSDDGFLIGEGAFKSETNKLKGDLRGDVSGIPTPVNNVPFFNVGTARSGIKTDLDGDGDLDLGSNVTSGTVSPDPWFRASTGTMPQMGGGAVGAATDSATWEFLIGRTTFTRTGGTDVLTSLNFFPRLRTDGGVTGPRLHRFTVDGADYAVDANGNGSKTVGLSSTAVTGMLAVGQPLIFYGPEPTSAGLALAATGMLLRRKKR